MQIRTTRHFERSYSKAPPAIKRAFLKQVAFLLEDIHHPSLRAKKYDEERWQARVSWLEASSIPIGTLRSMLEGTRWTEEAYGDWVFSRSCDRINALSVFWIL